MNIYNYLPRYHRVEPNNLKGLQPGFVVAQFEVADACTLVETDKVSNKKLLANGHLCTITADGIDQWKAGSTMFLHYTEPLNTIINDDSLFAVELENENPRLVQLIPGDEWMTDIDYENDAKYSALWTEINKHVLKLDGNTKLSNDDWFDVDTLADGVTKAYHYVFIG